MKMEKRDLLCLSDLDPASVWRIFNLADALREDATYKPLAEKVVALIFKKPSLRTRVSFEVAVNQLGGRCIVLTDSEIGVGEREEVKDVARVLSLYVDCIIARVFSHKELIELARFSDVPVINGLSDDFHPCQILSDLYTIWKKRAKIVDLNLAFIGDGTNNVVSSWLIAAGMMGMNITVASPKGFSPRKEVIKKAREYAKVSGAKIRLTSDPKKAVSSAEIIYTDVWTSMGREAEREERVKLFSGFCVNRELLSFAKKDFLVMHCLPAHRGEEITDYVIEGPRSIVFEQARNRLFVQKGILTFLLT
jgi:ornithine carbamoyltransferase